MVNSITIDDLNPPELLQRSRLDIKDQDRYLESQMSTVNGDQPGALTKQVNESNKH